MRWSRAGYRVYLYQAIMRQAEAEFSLVSISVYDEKIGYRYMKKADLDALNPANTYPINPHGHMARGEYTVAKPAGQFRIGVIGDSFTAGTSSPTRWPDVLMDRLNESDAWRRLVGGKETLVINFGLDGIGSMQFDEVLEEMALPFQLDFLIVNLLKENLMRRHYKRGYNRSKLGSGDRPLGEVLKAGFGKFLIRDLASCCYPEALAMGLGEQLGLAPRYSVINVLYRYTSSLSMSPPVSSNFDNPEDVIDGNLHTFRTILGHFPNALTLVHPTYIEFPVIKKTLVPDYRNNLMKNYDAAFNRLRALLPRVSFVDMLAYFPPMESRERLDGYFNTPDDQHHNDAGNVLYGSILARLMAEYCQPSADGLQCRFKPPRAGRSDDG